MINVCGIHQSDHKVCHRQTGTLKHPPITIIQSLSEFVGYVFVVVTHFIIIEIIVKLLLVDFYWDSLKLGVILENICHFRFKYN